MRISDWSSDVCSSDLDAPTVPLVSYPKVDAAALVGRSECVRFQAFQSYCPQRRRDGDNECAHNLSRSYRCSEETCPIVTQVYVEDGGRLGYGTSFEEEPAFDDANCERDTLVRPIHPNTTRSSAWRSAGVQQVEAVVNQVLHAKYRLGIEGGRYLFGAENERAVRQAIAEGYLVLDQEMPGFGLVVQASASLISDIEGRMRARSEEHTSELQSLMRISYAVFCLKKKQKKTHQINNSQREQAIQ